MSSVLTLPETLTIQTVQTEYENMAAQLSELNDRITLQASQVGNIDSAGLQLLLAFISKIQRDGKSFEWESPSDALLKSADNLGLTDQLQL